MNTHYLRFTRVLALGSALSACSSTVSGVDGSTGTDATTDSATATDGLVAVDVQQDATSTETDPCDMTRCRCEFLPAPEAGPTLPACPTMCCAAIGPLPPPELPA